MNYIKKFTLTKAYISWVVVSTIAWVICLQTGEMWKTMDKVVDLSAVQNSGATKNEMILGFIVISLIYWLVIIVISGVLVLLSNKQKMWAKYFLSLFCLYEICFEIYGSITTIYTYKLTPSIDDWVFTILSMLLLVYIGIRPHFKVKT